MKSTRHRLVGRLLLLVAVEVAHRDVGDDAEDRTDDEHHDYRNKHKNGSTYCGYMMSWYIDIMNTRTHKHARGTKNDSTFVCVMGIRVC